MAGSFSMRGLAPDNAERLNSESNSELIAPFKYSA